MLSLIGNDLVLPDGSFQTNGSESKTIQKSRQIWNQASLIYSNPYFTFCQIYQNLTADLSKFQSPSIIFVCSSHLFQHMFNTTQKGHVYHTAGMPPRSRTLSPFGGSTGFYVTGDQREASRGSTRNCQEYFAKRSFLDGVVKTSVTVRLLCGWKVFQTNRV